MAAARKPDLYIREAVHKSAPALTALRGARSAWKRHRPLPLALLLVAGCLTQSSSDLGADPASPVDGDDQLCDTTCELAAPSCCECPTFALPVSEGWGASCADAVCPDAPSGCAALEAVCASGSCVARCAPVTCELSCPNGFARDPSAGCLVCACAEAAPSAGCIDDGDCVAVPADCCGCGRGGSDTAVLAGDASSFLDALECPVNPACPDVDVCDPEAAARCERGACVLAGPSPVDNPPPGSADGGAEAGPALCGTPNLPPCPLGQACVLNDPAANDANTAGVGVCKDTP